MIAIPDAARRFGFSTNRVGGHMARSMMLPELPALFRVVAPEAQTTDYRRSIVEDNVLGKTSTRSNDQLIGYLAPSSIWPADEYSRLSALYDTAKAALIRALEDVPALPRD